MAALKSQDLYVTLKILSSGAKRLPYSQLAVELAMSPSEVHASVKRARASRLLHGPQLQDRPNVAAIEEFLVHGLKYAFPAEHGTLTRGVPTSYSASPLSSLTVPSNDPIPVWPHERGPKRGIGLKPLHSSAPVAALRDKEFYEYLALADALREGRVRERKIAEKELHRRLRKANAQFKS